VLLDPALEPTGPDAHTGIERFVLDRTRETRIFPVFERPRISVLHRDGEWYDGWLHGWMPAEPRPQWWGTVAYHSGVGLQHYVSLPARFIQQRADDHDPNDDDQDDAGPQAPF
jgi:hypothetical protein